MSKLHYLHRKSSEGPLLNMEVVQAGGGGRERAARGERGARSFDEQTEVNHEIQLKLYST